MISSTTRGTRFTMRQNGWNISSRKSLRDRIAARPGGDQKLIRTGMIPGAEAQRTSTARRGAAIKMGLWCASHNQQRVRPRPRGFTRDDTARTEARRGNHGGNGNAECLSAGPNWRSYGFSAPWPDPCLRNLGSRRPEWSHPFGDRLIDRVALFGRSGLQSTGRRE